MECYLDDLCMRNNVQLYTTIYVTNTLVLLLICNADLGSEGFGDLLACIRDKNVPLQNIHFVVWYVLWSIFWKYLICYWINFWSLCINLVSSLQTFRNNLNKVIYTFWIGLLLVRALSDLYFLENTIPICDNLCC